MLVRNISYGSYRYLKGVDVNVEINEIIIIIVCSIVVINNNN